MTYAPETEQAARAVARRIAGRCKDWIAQADDRWQGRDEDDPAALDRYVEEMWPEYADWMERGIIDANGDFTEETLRGFAEDGVLSVLATVN